MKEIVKVTSPPLQAKCLCCGKTSKPFQQIGEIEVEKYTIPLLDEATWSIPDGEPFKKDEINNVPSICPGCQTLGLTLEMFGMKTGDQLCEEELDGQEED